MKFRIAIFVAALSVALGTGFVSTGAFAQEQDCLSGRDAQAAVESGDVLELPSAARRAGLERKFIGDEARLCKVDGTLHWVVSVMNQAGDSERVVLNATGE